MTAHPHVADAEAYVDSVLSGEVQACRLVRLACQRHRDDDAASADPSYPYEFEPAAAERVCKFAEIFPHTKGRWAARNEKFSLAPWQAFAICMIFGWKRRVDRLRRFRKAMILVSRKNGKSDLSARIGLYMFAGDGEAGAEVYSGATSEKQAWEVFRPALMMSKAVPAFLEHYGVQPLKQSIAIPGTASRMEPLIGKPGDGASPSCAIVDEYHEHDTDDLVQTMITGMGAREQPLLLIISTAGVNTAGPCYAMVKEAERVLDGLVDDPELFALLYGLDDQDAWTDPSMLRKANPNYGVSVSEDYLLSRHRDAMQNARMQGIYQVKHLNRWVGARTAYFELPKWLACRREVTLDQFHGQQCWAGLDLATKTDINALVLLFEPEPGRFVVFGRFYLPEATVDRHDNQHYQAWAREGRLIVTDGEIVDMERIRDDVLDLGRRFRIDLGYDPYQATMMANSLASGGMICTEVGQTVLNFSQPMKDIDGLIRTGSMEHDGCPVMTWMIGNVTAKVDAKENVYPRKERPENKIDGPVALIIAKARHGAQEATRRPVSVYERLAQIEQGSADIGVTSAQDGNPSARSGESAIEAQPQSPFRRWFEIQDEDD